MVKKYTPERGDIAWLTLDPRFGHEQKGRRPVIILSPRYYNAKSELILACPITSTARGYTFEVATSNPKINGVILADQVASFAWKERKAKYIGRISTEVLKEVCEKIGVIIKGE